MNIYYTGHLKDDFANPEIENHALLKLPQSNFCLTSPKTDIDKLYLKRAENVMIHPKWPQKLTITMLWP